MGRFLGDFGSLGFGAVKSHTLGSGVETVCFFSKEAEKTTIGVVFLELCFFGGSELAFTSEGEDALTIFVIRFAVGRFVTNVDAGTVAGNFVAGDVSGSGGLDGGGCGCFLLVDVIGGSKEKVCRIGEVLPFGWVTSSMRVFLRRSEKGSSGRALM